MKRQLSFSIISRNQISSGRELRFLPLESHSGKFVTHQVHMMIENKQLPNGCIGKWSISVFVEQVQGCALRKYFYYIQIHTGLGSNIVYFL